MPADPLIRHVALLVERDVDEPRCVEVVPQRAGERRLDVAAPMLAGAIARMRTASTLPAWPRAARAWTSGGPRVKARFGNDCGRAGEPIDGDPIAAIDRQHRRKGRVGETPVAGLGPGMEMMGPHWWLRAGAWRAAPPTAIGRSRAGRLLIQPDAAS